MKSLGLPALFLVLASVALAQTKLAGTVQDDEGHPVEGAAIVAIAIDGGLEESPATGTTNASGAFELSLSRGQRFSVEVVAPGHGPWRSPNVAPSETLEIVLPRGGQILEGVVRDAESLEPVAFAVVETSVSGLGRALAADPLFGRVQAMTDEAGRFRLDGLGAGPVSVSASARGYARATRRGGAPGESVELLLFPGTGLSGRVLDPEGNPAEGALVEAEPTSAARGDLGRVDRADAEGRFTLLGLEPGRYRLFAHHGDSAPAVIEVTLEEDRDAEVELALLRGASLKGRVIDEEETPVTGKVRVRAIDGGSVGRILRDRLAAEADRDGAFELRSLPPGELTLEIDAPGYAPARIEASVGDRPGTYDLGDVVLQTGLVLRGRVQSEDEQPIADAHVLAFDVGGGLVSLSEQRQLEARSDAEGRFLLAGLSDGVYRIFVRAPGFAASKPIAAEAGKDVTVVLTPAGGIRGVVADENGRPVAGVRVLARAKGSRVFGGGNRFEEPGGVFVLEDLGAGEYVVEIGAPEYASEVVSNVRVIAGSTTELGTVHLRRGARVAGIVVDTSGAPIVGAAIEAREPGILRYRGLETSATSDVAGRFTVDGLSEGNIELVATHPDFAEARRQVRVDTSSETEVELVLESGGAIEGLVHSRDGTGVAARTIALAPLEGGRFSSSEDRTETAEDGSFRLEHVAPGPVEVALLDGGSGLSFAVQSKRIEVSAGETTLVEFFSRRVHVHGQVRKEGVPMAGVELELAAPDGSRSFLSYGGGDPSFAATASGPRYLMARTNEEGYYELLVDEPGEYRLTASVGGVGLPSRTLVVPDVDVVPMDLDFGGARVSGRVLDASTEQPVAGVFVGVRSNDPETSVSAGMQTGRDGRFELSLEPGDYVVWARGEGYGAWEGKVEVGASGIDDLVVSLTPGLVITGTVRDRGGRGGGLRIFAVEDGPDLSVPPTRVSMATSLPDGSFALDGLPRGRFNVVAGEDAATGFAFAASVPAGSEDVTLVMREAASVAVAVIDEDGTPVPGIAVVVVAIDGHRVQAAHASTGPHGHAELVTPSGQLTVKAARPGGPEAFATVSVPAGGRGAVELTLVPVAPR